MWAILMGWSAAAGVVDWTMALPMYAGGIAWGVAYDCIYAHQVSILSHCLSISRLLHHANHVS